MDDTYQISGVGRISGTVRIPGDKSISHRALFFNALADGRAVVSGINQGDDVGRTRRLLEALGTRIVEREDGSFEIFGRAGTFDPPQQALDCGNSGTTARLAAGILGWQPFAARMIGDESLSSRPMDRIAEPLRLMGAEVTLSDSRTLPMEIRGARLSGIDFVNRWNSAQVKSCVLLAGLGAAGAVRVTERIASRDHSERMLKAMGIGIEREEGPAAGATVTLLPGSLPKASDMVVPADVSAAAFFLLAALLLPDSRIEIPNLLLNPTRSGVLDLLRRMGGNIEVSASGETGGEPTGLVSAESSELFGIGIAEKDVVRSIDEFPILCVAAAHARGRTTFSGISELRHKESDRVAVMGRILRESGISCRDYGDEFTVEGGSPRTGSFDSQSDHRIAMAAIVHASALKGQSFVHGTSSISVSFPEFEDIYSSHFESPGP